MTFVIHGHKFFNADNFTEQGRAYQRRFLYGFAGFIFFVFALGGLAVALS